VAAAPDLQRNLNPSLTHLLPLGVNLLPFIAIRAMATGSISKTSSVPPQSYIGSLPSARHHQNVPTLMLVISPSPRVPQEIVP